MVIEMRVTSKYIYIYTDTEIIEFPQNENDIKLEDKLYNLFTSLGHEVIRS